MITPCQCCEAHTPPSLADIERAARNAAIRDALVASGSNVTHAARALGISARQLQRILAEGEIVKPPKPPKPAKVTRPYKRRSAPATK